MSDSRARILRLLGMVQTLPVNNVENTHAPIATFARPDALCTRIAQREGRTRSEEREGANGDGTGIVTGTRWERERQQRRDN